jgi:hypothetical protein
MSIFARPKQRDKVHADLPAVKARYERLPTESDRRIG